MGSASRISWPCVVPPWYFGDGGGGTLNTTSLSLQNDGIGAIITAPATDTITDIGYRQGATTGTPASNSYTIGAQTVDTSGNPSGTYLASGNGKATLTPAGANDGTWQWISLGANPISVTAGDLLALTLIRTAASDALNKITAAQSINWAAGTMRNSILDTPAVAAAGVWSKQANLPTMGMRSATTAYGYPLKSIVVGTSYGNTVEAGMLFTIPSTFCSTFTLAGVRVLTSSPSAAKTVVISLYTLNGSRVPQTPPTSATVSLDSDTAATVGSNLRFIQAYFSSTPTLTSGQLYAIGIATTTAANANLYSNEVGAVGDWDAWPGQQTTALTSRTVAAYPPGSDATAFAAGTTTQRPLIELLFGDITFTGGGGSGMLYVPNMAGT